MFDLYPPSIAAPPYLHLYLLYYFIYIRTDL